jgi:hypothetical protein
VLDAHERRVLALELLYARAHAPPARLDDLVHCAAQFFVDPHVGQGHLPRALGQYLLRFHKLLLTNCV